MQLFHSKSSAFSSRSRGVSPVVQGALLGVVALLLLMLNLFFPQLLTNLRVTLTDFFAPVLHAVAGPGQDFVNVQKSWVDWNKLHEENLVLKQQVAELKAWRDQAIQSAAENKDMRGLLKYKDDSVLSFLTVRVIAEAGDHFANSVIVTAGKRDGVVKNMVALNEDGVVGRVIEVGEWSSRVLLLNDLNCRLPVMIEGSNARAILAGDGQKPPMLLYVSAEASIKPGMRITTSGHGGIFPPYLPVGVIKEIENQGGAHTIRVVPYAALDRLQVLRLAVYQLAGGNQNPVNQSVNQQEPAHGNGVVPEPQQIDPEPDTGTE